MDIRRAKAQQTVKKTSRSWRLGMAGLLAAVLLAFSSTAWAAAMVTDGGFPSPNTTWSLGSAANGVASVSTAQNHGTLAGTGSFLEAVTGRAKTSTGTATQSVTITAGGVINAKTDVVVWAMEQWTLAASTARTITIDLRYSDATTVNIFTGTVGANSAWTNVTNTTATAFPLTLAKNVNQITVSLASTTGGTNGATSNLYADDIAITFTPAVVDSLTVTSNTPVATTGQPSQTNIQMQRLQLNSDATGNGSCIITSATVDDVNVAATGTIANLKVHVDANTNFSDGVLGTATVANWNGQSTVVDLTAIAAASRTVTSGTPKYLWVTYDITAGALDGTTCISRITAIGVLSPDNAPLGGPWDSNSVLITAGLGCGGCHPLPVLDGAARNGTTGAVVGNHATHGTTFAYNCNTCHIEGSQTPGGTYTSRHRRGTIEMNVSGLGGVANARYDRNGDHVADTVWSQTPAPAAWGKCENTACHGGVNSATSYGGPTGVGPTWGAAHTSTCTFCHNRAKADSGVAADAYPTAASPFRSANAAGAHLTHLTLTSNLMNGGSVACADCHTVPGTVNAAGHILTNITAPADLTFGARAQLNTTTTAYDSGTLSCSVYCHGFKTPGGDAGALDSTPPWTANWTTYVPGTAGTCSNYCHGLPPSDTTHSGKAFPASCKSCHGSTVTTTTDPPAIVASFHINGTVEATGCTGCHGTDPKQYPPVSAWGTNKSTADGVGAHVAHLEATATYMSKEAIAPESNVTGYWCAECHTTTRGATGHDDASYPANIAFTNAVESKYNTHTATITFEADNNPDAGNGATCSVYCHGVKMPKGDTSGTTKTPTWGVTLTGCGVCHGFPPTAGTSASTHTGKTYLDCKTCHASTIADTANPPTLIPAFHINGTVEATGCTGCHGTDPKQYPPVSFWGTNKSTADGVGAHVAHLEATSTYMTKEAITGETNTTGYWCAECHTTTRGATGHDDAAYPANIAFTNAVESKYNTHTATITFEADNNPDAGNGATCSVYCHGAKMPYGDTLGSARTPTWGATLTGCGVCHGFPPTPTGTHAGVTLGTQCGSCHTATMTNGNATITNTANHINGTLEVTTSCTGCHNGSGTGAKKVGPSSSHTDPDGAGATYAAGGNHCAVCHFAGTDHSGEATGTIAVAWDNRTMGTTAYDGTTDGSYRIHLRKIGGTEASEAAICWGCHGDVTVPSLPAAIKEFGATQGQYTTGTLNQMDWNGAAWTSANFAYKNGAIQSVHQTGSSYVQNPAKVTTTVTTSVSCTSCHDVHKVGNNGFTPTAAPYLRGSWTSNPFKEDGAPQKGVTYTSNRGSVPRGIDGTAANGYGGWQIEQNNATFTNATYAGATGYAGLCANCHTQAGLEQNAWAGFTTNGHKGAVSGFTGGAGGADLFSDTRRGGTNSWTRGYMSYNGVTNGRNGTSIGGLRNNRDDGWTIDGIQPANAPTSPPGAITYPAGAVTTITAGAVYQANFHNFPCSKCHSPHASRLPRLMITNCLDIKKNTWDDQTPAPIAAGVPQSWAAADSHLADEISYSSTAQNCHRYVAAGDTKLENGSTTGASGQTGWNTLTPW